MVKWLELYNCNEDPFAIKPLTTTADMEFYHKTQDIKDHIISILDKRNPGIYGITGMRGIGKTSTLYYIGDNLSKKNEIIVSIRIIQNVGVEISPKILSATIIHELLESLIKLIFRRYTSIFLKYEKLFYEAMIQLGMEKIEDRLIILYTPKKDLELQKKYIIEIICILRDNNYKTSILIDNLDKFQTIANQHILREFLSGPFTQSFFEEITSYDSKIFLTLSSEVYDYIKSGSKSWEGLNYLTSTIELNNLKDMEAIDLLSYRFGKVSDFPFPFNSGAIEFINNKSKGISRTLLWNAKYIMQIAAERKIELITDKIVIRLLKTQSIFHINENLKNESSDFRNATIWLLDIVSKIKSNDEKDKLMKSMINLNICFLSRDNILDRIDLEYLRKKNIISNSSLDIISEHFLYLISTFKDKNVDFSDWLKWYIKTDFNFKNITSHSDHLQNKLKRLLFYVDNYNFSPLIKIEKDKKRIYEDRKVKQFVKEDLNKIIDKIEILNIGKFEEASDSELVDIIGEITYLFMRMTNNIVYSEKQMNIDFNIYGSTMKLFEHSIEEIGIDKSCFDTICKIEEIKRSKYGSKSFEIRNIFSQCKKEISKITDFLISLIQKKKREVAKRKIEDQIPSVETISTFLRLSTGNWCHLFIEGHSPSELNIILWEQGGRYFTISSGNGKDFQKYFDTIAVVI